MAERFFDLPIVEQAELLHSLAPVIGRRAEILEKDIWLCLVLDILFKLPCRKPMAFKGGTSLSKVYQAIIVSRRILMSQSITAALSTVHLN